MALELQQSVNQIWSSATWAAGLYAHLPQVQQKRAQAQKIKSLSKSISEGEQRSLAIEEGYQKAGASLKEAQVAAHKERKRVVSEKEELARLTQAGPRAYEDIAYDEEMLAVQQEELKAAQQRTAQDIQARQANRERVEAARKLILEGSVENPIQPREVIKYGK